MTAGALGDPVLIGPYRLLDRLGEGGMGVVHLALDPQGRAVALKVLRAHVAADPQARRRLAREVETLRRVRHPAVAQVLDADIDADVPYLVTSFVPGRSLEEHVREQGPLTPEHVAHIGRRIAGALDAIHGVGIVHRDLKPANVMLLEGEPVLIDFGIAHMVDESRITMTGLVMGTPGYLSPEVVDGQPVTAATDWWGWGATLAYAASGRSPFGSGSATLVLDRVRRGVCDLAGIDARLAGVLAAALVVEPWRRAPSQVLLEGLAGIGPWAPWRPPPVRQHVWTTAPAAPTEVVPPPASPPPSSPPSSPPPVTQRVPDPVHDARTVAHVPTPVAATRIDAVARPPTVVAPPPGAPEPAPPVDLEAMAEGRIVRSTLLLALVTVSALAAVVPGFAVVLSVLWVVAARTVDRSVVGLLRRRYAHGRRPSDGAATVAALPWRVLGSIGVTVLATIVPVLMGASAAFLTAAGAAPSTPHPNRPWPLAVGMAAAWLAAWWGPGGGSVRRGTRGVARSLVRRRPGRIGALVALGFVCVAALLVAGNATHGAPDWTPLVPR